MIQTDRLRASITPSRPLTASRRTCRWWALTFNDALFENPGFQNHSLTLKLEGRRSNRSAIGARLRLHIDERGVKRTVHHSVSTGSSFGANSLRQVIGIGQSQSVERLEVDWPTSGITQTFLNVAGDRAYLLVEGTPELSPLPLYTFQLGKSPDP